MLQLIRSEQTRKGASAQDIRALEDLKTEIESGLRSETIVGVGEQEIFKLVVAAEEQQDNPEWMDLLVKNRQKLLTALETDAGELECTLPQAPKSDFAGWLSYANRGVLRETLVETELFEVKRMAKSMAARYALENVLVAYHTKRSLDDCFAELYQLFTGRTRLKLGAGEDAVRNC